MYGVSATGCIGCRCSPPSWSESLSCTEIKLDSFSFVANFLPWFVDTQSQTGSVIRDMRPPQGAPLADWLAGTPPRSRLNSTGDDSYLKQLTCPHRLSQSPLILSDVWGSWIHCVMSFNIQTSPKSSLYTKSCFNLMDACSMWPGPSGIPGYPGIPGLDWNPNPGIFENQISGFFGIC